MSGTDVVEGATARCPAMPLRICYAMSWTDLGPGPHPGQCGGGGGGRQREAQASTWNPSRRGIIQPARRNQMQENRISARFVPGVCWVSFDFGMSANAMMRCPCGMLLRIRDAMSGTELGYAATRSWLVEDSERLQVRYDPTPPLCDVGY
eukprot:168311-Rhodomonas_salina.6